MRKLSAVVMALLSSACARNVLIPASPLTVLTPAEGETKCIERLLAKARMTGYIEETVDKEMGFFRVRVRENIATAKAAGKRAAKVPKGKALAVVAFYNIQCTGPETAVVTPMNANGALDDRYLMDEWQVAELENFSSRIGVIPQAAAAPAPAPTQAEADSTAPPKCVASENPEWAGASAARKKELLEACK